MGYIKNQSDTVCNQLNNFKTMKQYEDINGIVYNINFTCSECNCKRFERPQYCSRKLTFLEGYFHCLECFAEFSYNESAFTLTESQLNLFQNENL